MSFQHKMHSRVLACMHGDALKAARFFFGTLTRTAHSTSHEMRRSNTNKVFHVTPATVASRKCRKTRLRRSRRPPRTSCRHCCLGHPKSDSTLARLTRSRRSLHRSEVSLEVHFLRNSRSDSTIASKYFSIHIFCLVTICRWKYAVTR